MKFKANVLGIESGGKFIVYLNSFDADDLGITPSSRVQLKTTKKVIAIVNTSKMVKRGFLGVNDEVKRFLGIKQNSIIDVDVSEFPKSLQYIRNKLFGRKLVFDEIHEIVKDVVGGSLNESEIAAFVTTLHIQGLDLDEATSLSKSMVATGKQLKLNKKIIVDKHSVGGVPGDKTTLLVVPIIAAAGLTIPKTSSRAITSAAGTADRAESLMPVDLNQSEMLRVVRRSNGCIVWGGSLDLAPADDIFVQTEYPLYIDPLLLPSIMSKKKAVGATHLVIDIPTGKGAKIKTIADADLLAHDLIELGKRLNIHTHCVLTYADQPMGYAIGPSLEAKEAFEVISNLKHIPDVIDKACTVAGSIFEITGRRNGYSLAKEILKSGKAEKKLRQIISLQGGNDKIKTNDFSIGHEILKVKATKSGHVIWIDNSSLVEIARSSGAPKDKGAGILLNKKIGDLVSKNDILFTICAQQSRKLTRAQNLLEERDPIGIGDRKNMLIHKIQEKPYLRKEFVIDR